MPGQNSEYNEGCVTFGQLKTCCDSNLAEESAADALHYKITNVRPKVHGKSFFDAYRITVRYEMQFWIERELWLNKENVFMKGEIFLCQQYKIL